MKKLNLFTAICFLSLSQIKAQTITPSPSTEFCPGVNITFSVSLPGQGVSSVNGVAVNIAPTVVQQPFNISVSGGNVNFDFIGKFADYNNKQTFRVSYTNGAGQPATWDAPFIKIKSLLTSVSCAQVPSQSTINAPRCQIDNFNISFSNVQYGNPNENPQICYGTVTNYEYLLPNGWSIGANVSNGSTWIQDDNTVTITSDLSNGVNGAVKVRPINTACTTGLAAGLETTIPISRPAPSLYITKTQNYICNINGTVDYTMNGMPSGSSIVWSLPSGNTDVVISGSSTSPTVTLQSNTTSNRTIEVTGTVTHCTFTYPVIEPIVLGVGNVTCQEIGNGTCNRFITACPSGWQYVNLFGTPGPSGTGYHLQVNGGGYFNNGLTTQDITTNYFSVYVPSGGNNVTIWANNACGTCQNTPHVIIFNTPGCRVAGNYTVSPNPANNIITVSTAKNTKDGIIQINNGFVGIEIIDRLGNTKRKLKYPRGTTTTRIDVSSLPTGYYVLRIFNGINWEELKVLVIK